MGLWKKLLLGGTLPALLLIAWAMAFLVLADPNEYRGTVAVTVGLSLVAEGVYGHLSEDEHPCRTALAREMQVTPEEYRERRAAEQK